MKIVGAILTVIVLGFIGFVCTVIMSLSGNEEFYVPFIPTVTAGLIVIAVLAIYGKLKTKILKLGSVTFITLSIVSLTAYEGYQVYLESLEVVSAQDIDLSTYQPFTEETKLVSLQEPSTYTIVENLPMLDGATALYPVYAAFAQTVYPEKEYPLEDSEVVSNQTSNAFNRLINGDADIVFMAHPSENQMKIAEKNGTELALTPIGREAFVFFVHKKNPIEELSIRQIQAIFSGEITNWKEVGGNDQKIRAFQRPEGSGSQSALLSVMNGKPLMESPSEDIVTGMGGIIRETTNYRNRTNAIGFSFRHFSQEMVQNGKIKYIAVEGISPTKENIQNNTYPIIDKFYAIHADKGNPHVKDFIDWMQSEQGQKIINETGYVPLK